MPLWVVVLLGFAPLAVFGGMVIIPQTRLSDGGSPAEPQGWGANRHEGEMAGVRAGWSTVSSGQGPFRRRPPWRSSGLASGPSFPGETPRDEEKQPCDERQRPTK